MIRARDRAGVEDGSYHGCSAACWSIRDMRLSADRPKPPNDSKPNGRQSMPAALAFFRCLENLEASLSLAVDRGSRTD